MKELELQPNAKPTDAIEQVETAMSFIEESPALKALEAKLMRRHRKRVQPHTYRRPAHLKYIEYA